MTENTVAGKENLGQDRRDRSVRTSQHDGHFGLDREDMTATTRELGQHSTNFLGNIHGIRQNFQILTKKFASESFAYNFRKNV